MAIMKKTLGGVLAARIMDKRPPINEHDNPQGDGICVGQNFKYGTLDMDGKPTDPGFFPYATVEFDDKVGRFKVVVISEFCEKFGVPVVVCKRNKDGSYTETPADLMPAKKYVLSECCELDISTDTSATLAEAQQEMFKRYIQANKLDWNNYSHMTFPACLEELKKDEEAYGNDAQISEKEAYVLDGSNHDNYCWKITEI